ncbi:MAG TPA: type II secretion system F family protein [Spirochaetota bacterium]|nr:type II secretion system F family protein [Spirochaetota bacterium]HNT10692.1 type II secretion system F family protein [Spirochaetota bacterium]HNV46903.1 type II secretion system F family protein [Spirochaetota bacterium]HOS40668.1 type II secretion system F family protein [Spirochaetota bacterium]HPU89796.1 type II secretion system F family protein [Spirochaetota bacterium]
MIFEYQALNKKGDTVYDFVDAPTDVAARQKLRGQGLYVVKLTKHEVHDRASSGSGIFGKMYADALNFIALKISSKQVGIFSRQLATLLRAGMPLPVAIADIIEQIENQNFKKVVVDIREKLEEGSSLSNALTRHRVIFSEMYISMVRVGENLGSLDQVIERLADLEEKKNILKSKIQAALWYPSFMIFFAIAVVVFLMVNIIPSLSRMFIDLGRELPLPTKIVMGISGFFSTFWWVLIILFVGTFYYLNHYIKTPEGRRKFDEFKLDFPLVSKLYRKLIVLRFTQNLGILLNNKVDIIKSFEIVKKIVMNVIIEERIEDASKRIKEGSSVSNALSKSGFLPKLVMGMITAGEASDNLDTMLLNIGKVYETEIDLTVTSLTNLIEPFIIIFMGIVIGSIVISVLLPIFEMNLIMQ